MKLKNFFIALIFLALLTPTNARAGEAFDHSAWDAFLKKFVNERGEVDYTAAKQDPSLLNEYLEELAAQDPLEIASQWPREKAMAFWMNAYNAGVVKMVLEHYPVKTLGDISSAWDITIIHVGPEQYSLNQIRNQQLMQTYHDEKVHLALSCGSRACPRLDREVFTGANVEGKLFLATREFLNDPAKVEIIPGRKKIHLSRLFKWYGKDFNLDFGTPERIEKFSREEMSILSFLIYYTEDLDKLEYLESGRYKIAYMPFDSTLNDWKGSRTSLPRDEEVATVSSP